MLHRTKSKCDDEHWNTEQIFTAAHLQPEMWVQIISLERTLSKASYLSIALTTAKGLLAVQNPEFQE